MSNLHKFVKVKGYPNWFLLLSNKDEKPLGIELETQQKMTRTLISSLHDRKSPEHFTIVPMLNYAIHNRIDYVGAMEKCGPILIREIGSFMPLRGNEIEQKIYSTHFPVDEYGDVVICENDVESEHEWNEYLKKRFPNQKIVTINFFDLRSDDDVADLFSKAKCITFSTTFSKFDWFEKLSAHVKEEQKVIGYCHDESKWEEALEINKNVEIVKTLPS